MKSNLFVALFIFIFSSNSYALNYPLGALTKHFEINKNNFVAFIYFPHGDKAYVAKANHKYSTLKTTYPLGFNGNRNNSNISNLADKTNYPLGMK